MANILISGAGIAGPTLAFWLSRAGHVVTIVERASDLRMGDRRSTCAEPVGQWWSGWARCHRQGP